MPRGTMKSTTEPTNGVTNGVNRGGGDRKYDAIVVGGGHNGLTNAAYLAKGGLRTLVLERRNLVGGALNGGTAQLHQQAVLRPFPGLGRPETPVRGLYLASASAHPGGGLHGGPGGNAARAALSARAPSAR